MSVLNLITSGLNNLTAPTLKVFYDRYASGLPEYIPSLDCKFAVWIIPFPTLDFRNPLTYCLAKEALNSASDLFVNKNIALNPFNFISLYSLSVNLPNISMDVEEIPTDFGKIIIPGIYTLPEKNTITFEFINTDLSIVDTFIYMWMQQVTSQNWVYSGPEYSAEETVPYAISTMLVFPIADINVPKLGYVSIPKQIYLFTRCFPISMSLPKYSQQDIEIQIREVTFCFTKIFVIPNIFGLIQSLYKNVANPIQKKLL